MVILSELFGWNREVRIPRIAGDAPFPVGIVMVNVNVFARILHVLSAADRRIVFLVGIPFDCPVSGNDIFVRRFIPMDLLCFKIRVAPRTDSGFPNQHPLVRREADNILANPVMQSVRTVMTKVRTVKFLSC